MPTCTVSLVLLHVCRFVARRKSDCTGVKVGMIGRRPGLRGYSSKIVGTIIYCVGTIINGRNFQYIESRVYNMPCGVGRIGPCH